MGLNAVLKRLAGRLAPSFVLARGRPACGAVALTFDDGPHTGNTPMILDVLSRYAVPATFFVQGTNAAAAADLVRAIAAGGHVVGNHGFEHRHWTRQPTAATVRDVERNQALIDATLGQPQPKLYRPPFGEITPSAAARLWRLGFRLVFWSVDSRDSFPGSPEAIIESSDGARSGDILLFHDDGEHTVAILPRLIERVLQRGLAIRPLSELHARPGS